MSISIHALREEGDGSRSVRDQCLSDFYPRPPRGGRQRGPADGARLVSISIHALREEGDHLIAERSTYHEHFYPRPPRGGRQTVRARRTVDRGFLSTPSARRATPRSTANSSMVPISIHALREEGDRAGLSESAGREDFYPRPPRGGRQKG